MKYYKLLNQDLTSYKGQKWEVGVPVTISKPGNKMCSDEVLHCYNHPLLSTFLNIIHANIQNPRLFVISVDNICNSDGLKFASKSQTLLEEIPFINISIEKRVEIAIRVVKTVYREDKWNSWADKWLSGEDRSKSSASRDADYAVAYAVAYASAAAAASDAAAYASDAAYAAYAAYYAAVAAAADYAAATYATYAAFHAAVYKNDNTFNKTLIEIAERVCKE